MTDRYPGYDVLAKRWTQSWNEETGEVIDRRLAVPREPRFFSPAEWRTLNAVCDADRAAAQRSSARPAGGLSSIRRSPSGCSTAIVMQNCRHKGRPGGAGWRRWTQEAREAHGGLFHELAAEQQDGLLRRMQRGELSGGRGAACRANCSSSTGSSPTSPTPITPIPSPGTRSASAVRPVPRGYVRMRLDRRDPWEAVEAHPATRRARATEEPPCRLIRSLPRAPQRPRARTCSGAAAGCRCANIDEDEAVDFVVVGTGAGGGPLIAGLAEGGFSVVGFDAGPYFRPLEDFASDEREQEKLYWTDERVVDGANPITMGGKNSGKAVGGSTVHFAMVSLRFRPEWFKSRSALGYGADWPLDWREMWDYYTKAEQALSISGPLNYPWGPKRPRYPYRAHELNGAAELLARGAEAMGLKWTPTPLATVSAPHGKSPPCVYRGFCRFGCSTNAKQSQLVTFIPRALAAGAEIRDLAMVGRIEMGTDGRATGVHYHREGRWRFQKARNVVVAGYAIETPRLLLASATDDHPDGLANSSGLVGKNLMTQSNQAVFGVMERGGALEQRAAFARHHRALEL